LKRLATLMVMAACAACFSASATTTAVNALGGGDGSERCLVGTAGLCVGGAYNGAFSLINVFERDLGLGPFVRVDDNLDKIWANTAGGGEVQALARYASDTSKLGFDAGGGYIGLTNSLPVGRVLVNSAAAYSGDTRPADFSVAADAWVPVPLAAGVPFAFVLNDLTMGYKITSNPGPGVGSSGYANSGLTALDYMVTFKVPDAVPHYFIAWKDRNPLLGSTGDQDYQDLVVEVRYSSPLPEPENYALLFAGFALIGFVARRRHRGDGHA
jgi:hypothetical protein